jgi:hypothetical protein
MMEPCPYAPKKARGAHELCLVVPESDGNPLILACTRCGMVARHSVELPAPLDDLPSHAIAELTRRAP